MIRSFAKSSSPRANLLLPEGDGVVLDYHSSIIFRVDLAWKFTHTHLVPKPAPLLQKKCCSFHGLNSNRNIGREKDTKSFMDRRKPKTVTTMWKPVCTQSGSHEEYMLKDATVDLGNQHNLDVSGKTKIERQESDEGRSLGGSMPSTEKKHTIRIEVLIKGRLCALYGPRLQHVTVLRDGHFDNLSSLRALEAAAFLIRFIKGKESSTQKKIEENMGVEIKFPSSKEDYISRLLTCLYLSLKAFL